MYKKYLENKEYYLKAQRDYTKLLDEKQQEFDKTQPGAMKFEGERVTGGQHNNKWDNYIDKVKEIDERLEVNRQLMLARKLVLDLSEQDLRNSKNTQDMIFVARFLDRKKTYQITAIVNYSERQVKRYLKEIYEVYKPYKKRWHEMALFL